MLWPTLCIDNFFQNPDAVIAYAKKLKYQKTDGHWPGERSEPLHVIDPTFFHKVTNKIIAALYPHEAGNREFRWKATSQFQKIKTSKHTLPGFIHQDIDTEFTSIIYLSDEEDTGTSIYRNIEEPIYVGLEEKIKGYKNYKTTNKLKQAVKKNRSAFVKVFEFKPLKNRMIIFDGAHHHGVDNFGKKEKERLTLITFFETVYRTDGVPFKYHVNECTKF